MPTPAGSEPLLDITGLTLRFGGVQALSDVDVRISAGSICGLVGPNGAGKTSLFNCVCGYYRPTAGTIRALGRDVTDVAPYRLAALGLARTFQHAALQLDATVLENVLAGGHTRIAGDALSCALRLPRVRRDERALRDEARGLLSRPRLLLVDELASGLTQREVMKPAEQRGPAPGHRHLLRRARAADGRSTPHAAVPAPVHVPHRLALGGGYGGVSATNIDMTLQLVRWVENRVAPTEVDVTHRNQGVTRPVYPYPRIPGTTAAATPRRPRASTGGGSGPRAAHRLQALIGDYLFDPVVGRVDVPMAAGEEGGRRR